MSTQGPVHAGAFSKVCGFTGNGQNSGSAGALSNRFTCPHKNDTNTKTIKSSSAIFQNHMTIHFYRQLNAGNHVNTSPRFGQSFLPSMGLHFKKSAFSMGKETFMFSKKDAPAWTILTTTSLTVLMQQPCI